MTAHPDLADLLEQWRRLTASESDAIRACNWDALLTAQANKHDLQQEIDRACSSLGASGTAESKRIRLTASRLLEDEHENQQALAEQRHAAGRAYHQSQNSLRQLHELNRAYGQHSMNSWQSYS